jgi:hypothetical protein
MAIGQQGMVGTAIELSKKSWVVGIAHPDRDRPSIHRFVGVSADDRARVIGAKEGK